MKMSELTEFAKIERVLIWKLAFWIMVLIAWIGFGAWWTNK